MLDCWHEQSLLSSVIHAIAPYRLVHVCALDLEERFHIATWLYVEESNESNEDAIQI